MAVTGGWNMRDAVTAFHPPVLGDLISWFGAPFSGCRLYLFCGWEEPPLPKDDPVGWYWVWSITERRLIRLSLSVRVYWVVIARGVDAADN